MVKDDLNCSASPYEHVSEQESGRANKLCHIMRFCYSRDLPRFFRPPLPMAISRLRQSSATEKCSRKRNAAANSGPAGEKA